MTISNEGLAGQSIIRQEVTLRTTSQHLHRARYGPAVPGDGVLRAS